MFSFVDQQVLHFDSGMGGEPMNFWDAFLCSEALEGLTISIVSYQVYIISLTLNL